MQKKIPDFGSVLQSIDGVSIKKTSKGRWFDRDSPTRAIYRFSYRDRYHFELWISTFVDQNAVARNFMIQDGQGNSVIFGPPEDFTKSRVERALKNHIKSPPTRQGTVGFI